MLLLLWLFIWEVMVERGDLGEDNKITYCTLLQWEQFHLTSDKAEKVKKKNGEKYLNVISVQKQASLNSMGLSGMSVEDCKLGLQSYTHCPGSKLL